MKVLKNCFLMIPISYFTKKAMYTHVQTQWILPKKAMDICRCTNTSISFQKWQCVSLWEKMLLNDAHIINYPKRQWSVQWTTCTNTSTSIQKWQCLGVVGKLTWAKIKTNLGPELVINPRILQRKPYLLSPSN